jgi:hypothetical protein
VPGTFQIIRSRGTTTITFRQAELLTATFTGEGEERIGTGSSPVPFTPTLLELTISGDPVEPPSEATATPEPTATPDTFSAAVVPTGEPTLANVTRAPGSDRATTTPDQDRCPHLCCCRRLRSRTRSTSIFWFPDRRPGCFSCSEIGLAGRAAPSYQEVTVHQTDDSKKRRLARSPPV